MINRGIIWKKQNHTLGDYCILYSLGQSVKVVEYITSKLTGEKYSSLFKKKRERRPINGKLGNSDQFSN